MQLRISHLQTSIVFEFEPQPTPVAMFVVSDSNEKVQWEIAPVRSTERSTALTPVLRSSFVGVRVSTSVEHVISKAADTERERLPGLARIVYGQVPPGYREVAKPTELTPGQKYCVLVFGAGLDSASEFFTA